MTVAPNKAQRRQVRKQQRAVKQRQASPERKPLEALNARQSRLIDACRRDGQVFAVGLAGTGKTFLASAVACDKLLTNEIEKIVLCRPAVGVEEDIGFLPGAANKKMAPWVAPFMDVFKERLGSSNLSSKIESGAIEIVPIAFMRGRTFKNAFIILDEAQNCTLSQLKMVLTRVGENSTIVVTGDISQTDIGDRSGLKTVIDMINRYNVTAKIIQFRSEDVVRSHTCREWTEAFERHEQELRA